MNKRQRKKTTLTWLIRLDTNRSGGLPHWWRGQICRDVLAYHSRFPIRSPRYRRLMRAAGHAVRGGAKPALAMNCCGGRMTWSQWERRIGGSTGLGGYRD